MILVRNVFMHSVLVFNACRKLITTIALGASAGLAFQYHRIAAQTADETVDGAIKGRQSCPLVIGSLAKIGKRSPDPLLPSLI
jgi:hypothetical protein